MHRIFVAIACYRDPQCVATVRSLFDAAVLPERVSVGICWQFLPGRDERHFNGLPRRRDVRVICFDARDTQGVGWARSEAQALWAGEEYVLQIDAHMRFDRGWDTALVDTLDMCASPHAILSTYPARFRAGVALRHRTPHLVARRFVRDTLHLELQGEIRSMDRPTPGAFVAGGYAFARAEWLQHVPPDPGMFFEGEELSQSVRAYTHGWDVYSPHRCLVHHLYGRRRGRRPWQDDTAWARLNAAGLRRLRSLIEGDHLLEPAWRLGSLRSLADFEALAGVDLENRRVNPACSPSHRQSRNPTGAASGGVGSTTA